MADEIDITFRVCSKCAKTKPATAEYFDNYRDRGVTRQRTFCRDCLNARMRAYRKENPERVAAWERANSDRNKAAGSAYQKRRYAIQNKEKASLDLKKWKAKNPDKVRAAQSARNARVKALRKADKKYREKLAAKSRAWMRTKRESDDSFREKCNEKNREWLRSNKEKMRDYYRKKAARLRATDMNYRIVNSLRSRVCAALKGGKKAASVSSLLGCSIDEARGHIEQKFQDGMNWENWGRGWGGAKEWHIDHIKPLSSFDLTDLEQLSQACHYTNLQPLWAKDNIAKGPR